jgi:hypothetical protein
LPKGEKVIVELENKKKTDKTGAHDADEAMWNDPAVQVNHDRMLERRYATHSCCFFRSRWILKVSVTLYRDSKGAFQTKIFTLRLKRASDGLEIASFALDASQVPLLTYSFNEWAC